MTNKTNDLMLNRRIVSPVTLFAYNRPQHTELTLAALGESELSKDTDLFVFIDGPRDKEDRSNIKLVRDIIEKCTAFREIKIIQRSENLGLARNIIDGVSQVVEERGRVIVLEDDIVVSEGFLAYMNDALDYYEEQPKVWHISGYNEDINSTEYDRTFFSRTMRCWGWATWKDRWQHFQKNPEALIKSFSASDINKFNLDGFEEGFWRQILKNSTGEIDTWAVFWYATIFRNKGLCLNPVVSHVRNIGFDGTGTHCSKDDGKYNIVSLNTSKNFIPPSELIEDVEITRKLKAHYRSHQKQEYPKGNFFNRLTNRSKLALKTILRKN